MLFFLLFVTIINNGVIAIEVINHLYSSRVLFVLAHPDDEVMFMVCISVSSFHSYQQLNPSSKQIHQSIFYILQMVLSIKIYKIKVIQKV